MKPTVGTATMNDLVRLAKTALLKKNKNKNKNTGVQGCGGYTSQRTSLDTGSSPVIIN